MRTTLTLDPDVALLLKERVAEAKTTMKDVVNDALRRGLVTAPPPGPDKPFRVTPFSIKFRPGIDQDKLNQLVDELEVQEFAAKYARDQNG